MRASVAIGLFCLLSAAGCGDDSSSSSSSEPPAFEGVAWVVADGTVRPSATFENARVSGSGGCNRYSGDYEADGESLTISKIAATRIACRPPADEVEREYFAALEEVAKWRIDGGQLVLFDDGSTELLRFAKASPQGRWKVTSLQTGSALESPIPGTALTADFAKDGSLTGSAGCNSYTTTYVIDSDGMTIKPAASTRKACATPEGVMEQEAAYLSALETVKSFDLAGDHLTLQRADGTIAVSLAR